MLLLHEESILEARVRLTSHNILATRESLANSQKLAEKEPPESAAKPARISRVPEK
jgi:hypothetical protein